MDKVMPCTDWPVNTAVLSSSADRTKLNQANAEIRYLSGLLCALLKEVDEFVIARAEKNGQCSFDKFKKQHEQRDKQRLKQRLKKMLETNFSDHEIAMIKSMLNE